MNQSESGDKGQLKGLWLAFNMREVPLTVCQTRCVTSRANKSVRYGHKSAAKVCVHRRNEMCEQRAHRTMHTRPHFTCGTFGQTTVSS